MSRNSSDSDRYIPIKVLDRPRDRRPSGRPEPVNNNFFLDVPDVGGRRRAASTGGAAQPINLIIGDNRSRSGGGHSRRDSSSGSSDRRSHRSRRSTIYEDDLPYEIRRKLDLANQVEADDRRRSRERRRDRSRDEEEYERRRDRERWEDEFEERERKKKREKERIKEELEQEEKNKEKERVRIIEEAKEKEKQRKRDEEKQKEKWLEEEEEKKRKKKKEKEEQERAVEEAMKKKFREAGYSEAHIDDILHRRRSRTKDDKEWAIDLSRPTFIKVHRKYLSPDTLDYYYLPWEWDKHNSEYIIIKKYITQDFQDELFRHTKLLKEKKTITSGYVKETTTTLKPREEIVKDKSNDQMYLVRSKSRSRSGDRRRSWMFT